MTWGARRSMASSRSNHPRSVNASRGSLQTSAAVSSASFSKCLSTRRVRSRASGRGMGGLLPSALTIQLFISAWSKACRR
jgi:hypothetical protein